MGKSERRTNRAIVTFVVEIDNTNLRYTTLQLAKEIADILPNIFAGVNYCFIAEIEKNGKKITGHEAHEGKGDGRIIKAINRRSKTSP